MLTEKEIAAGITEEISNAWDSAVINEGDTLAENRDFSGDSMRNACDNGYIYADMFGISLKDFYRAAAVYGYYPEVTR